jgi:periplasmic protein TonB
MIDRLQKKCIIASAGLHSLLVGLLLFGSALMPKPHEEPVQLLKVYRSEDVSSALSSGGNPDVQVAPNPLPPAAPVTPKPEATPPPKPAPEPPRPKPVEPVVKPIPEPPKEHHNFITDLFKSPKPEKVTKPTKEDVVPDKPKPHKIEIDPSALKPVVRNKNEKTDQTQAAADAKARAERKRLAKEISMAANTIGKNISSSTPVEIPGVGGPGPVSVNYGSIISSKYFDAWSPPTDVEESLATAEASVTIARDGSVISAHVTKSSGNASLDRSIENALSAVTFIEPFPASFKQQQITVTVPFNLRTKRQSG